MKFSRLGGLLLFIGITALTLAGCASGEASELPDFVRNAPPDVRTAYEYAVAHPDEVAKYPCYCGCNAMGHTSNLSCYVKEIGEDGKVVYDQHAAGCGICVDITKDVMRLKGEGKPSREVRAFIDARYSSFGPKTDTPLPLD